jgi:hypothetical protein
MESAKNRLSRDFWHCSIFDFCNSIRHKRSYRLLSWHPSAIVGDDRRQSVKSLLGKRDLYAVHLRRRAR